MAAPVKYNFKVYQGSTFRETIRWESSTKVYVPISNISKAAPMVITAPSHGVPPGWRVRVSGAQGMKELNSDYMVATEATTDTLTFNSINSTSYSTYVGGGILEYNQPFNLSGYSARMQIRQKLDDPNYLLELKTQDGTIQINNTAKTIVLFMSATTTAGLNFNTGVYSLELEGNGGDVYPIMSGTVSLVKEVTR